MIFFSLGSFSDGYVQIGSRILVYRLAERTTLSTVEAQAKTNQVDFHHAPHTETEESSLRNNA